MDLQLPSQANAGHRGSHSSIRSTKSTLAAHTQVYTPPHSPSTETMDMDTLEEDSVENKDDIPIGIVVDEPVQVVETVQDEALVEEQPTELRLSDFETVNTLGLSGALIILYSRLTRP